MKNIRSLLGWEATILLLVVLALLAGARCRPTF